jgi:hypothetical protein
MARGKGVGSERELRRTRLRAWPGLGRPGSRSPAGGSRAAEARERRKGSGGIASGGLRAATYREEKIREGREAEDHGGVEVAVLAALRRPVARAWQSRKRATEAG